MRAVTHATYHLVLTLLFVDALGNKIGDKKVIQWKLTLHQIGQFFC